MRSWVLCPARPPIPVPPRTPCSVLLPGLVPGEQQTPLQRAASAQKPPPEAVGLCKMTALAAGIWGKATQRCRALEKPITHFSPGDSVNTQEKFNLFRSWKLKFTSDAVTTSVFCAGDHTLEELLW